MHGMINHIAISVINLENSDIFWNPLMDFLGYNRTLKSDDLSVWESESTCSALNFWKSKEPQAYRYNAPGLHHIAFNAVSKSDVDNFFYLLQTLDVQVLDAPAMYDHYGDGYYAVYFKDINGFKIEFAYTPSVVIKK